MAREGVELLAPLEELAVMGFAEVVSRLPYFWKLERRLDRVLVEEGIDLVLPIDYPGFNLRMARRAWKRRIPVLYYICPQVWAWKARRAYALARHTHHVAVILPFEEEILQQAGARTTFVGHPLLDWHDDLPSRDRFADDHDLDPDRPILALFPGSRRQEVERHGPLFTTVARMLRSERSELQVGVARAEGITAESLPSGGGVRLVEDGRALLRHSRAALVKSGTTTLEAAIEGIPFVTVYRTHPITYFLARRLVQVDHVALANLVAGGRVAPELLQDSAEPEGVLERLRPLLDETEERRRVIAGLAGVREKLGTPGAARRVVEIAERILEEKDRTVEV